MGKSNASELFGDQLLSLQATKIIAKFGSVPKLVEALNFVGYKISRFSVYKWNYPKKGPEAGCAGGIIPKRSVPWVKRAARETGIVLEPADWEL